MPTPPSPSLSPSLSPLTVAPTSTTPTSTTTPSDGNKFGSTGKEPLVFKGPLELPRGFEFQRSCADALLENESVLCKKVPQLRFILKHCETACDSVMSSPAAKELVAAYGLTRDEVFSIVIYTFDLGYLGKTSENFYFQLNEMLRLRASEEMNAILAYLHIILSALRKLPDFKGIVYRGNDSRAIVAQEYTTGRQIFWSGFTSTSTDLDAARHFARTGGVVFRIKVNSGKSISALSVLGSESEVLLPPNACLVVSDPIHTEADGAQYVDLLEVADTFRW